MCEKAVTDCMSEVVQEADVQRDVRAANSHQLDTLWSQPKNDVPCAGTNLGQGAHGLVLMGLRSTVVKHSELGEQAGLPYTMLRELASLRAISSPHVIEVLDFDIKALTMTTPYLPCNLDTFVKTQNPKLTGEGVRFIMQQLVGGLRDAFLIGIVHRDIKPDNIVIDGTTLCLKIIDWGLSRFVYSNDPPVFSGEVQSILFRAPEVLLGERRYGSNIDIWSLGMLMLFLLLGNYPWSSDSEIGQLYRIFQEFGTPSEASWPGFAQLPNYRTNFPQWHPVVTVIDSVPVDPQAKDFLTGLLILNPVRRTRYAHMMKHPYIQGVHSNKSILLCLSEIRIPHVDASYMARQKGITCNLRVICLNWLEKVSESAKVGSRCLFTAAFYLDAYLSVKVIPVARFQLLAVTCLLVATKMLEVVLSLDAESASTYCGDCTLRHVEEQEIDLVTTLRGFLHVPMAFTVLNIHRGALTDAQFRIALRVASWTIAEITSLTPLQVGIRILHLVAPEITIDACDAFEREKSKVTGRVREAFSYAQLKHPAKRRQWLKAFLATT